MRILLDQSPAKIAELSDRYEYDFWQLRTPLTKYAIAGVPYGLDNGCFTSFNKQTWLRMIDEARTNKPIFACAPDIVGDAQRTIEMFEMFYGYMLSVPRALVLQDGIGRTPIPWNRISAVFIGGSDEFKISAEAIAACKTAKMLGLWVHVGRVNTVKRLAGWMGLADSIDGSGISMYDHMMEKIIMEIKGTTPQMELLEVQE
jgi:hypothetical protein